MATFYVGLSMAGTVSAGTYTAGCLLELDRWLNKWRQAVKANVPIELDVRVDTANYRKGERLVLQPDEIPKHEVKIKTLTGASGGGVSGALYLMGLGTNKVEEFLKDTWMSFNIEKMLDTSDLANKDAPIYSLLSSKPIEEVIQKIKEITWGQQNPLEDIDYIEDIVELYQTLSSFERIPYKLVTFHNNQDDVGIFNNHFDYIRFGMRRSKNVEIDDGEDPYRYDLVIDPGQPITSSTSWQKLVESTPATGAFPIGFPPRSVQRLRKEYNSKLFYLRYSMPDSQADFDAMMPIWNNIPQDALIDMEYFDGGAFNREPHDLARASLIRFLKKKEILGEDEMQLPPDGKDALASVILIDPFPATAKPHDPGTLIDGLPALLKKAPPNQAGLLIAALMGQGRFHADWIETTVRKDYYSRFLISPKRKSMSTCEDEDFMLAGEPFSAFCGFIDPGFRFHDYRLGHYNTFKFLCDHFAVPDSNRIVTYAKGVSPATLEKYKALGWVQEKDNVLHCQIIPRFEPAGPLNTMEPDWPRINQERWNQVSALFLERGYRLYRNVLEVGSLVQWASWKFFAKKKIVGVLEAMKKTLECARLIG